MKLKDLEKRLKQEPDNLGLRVQVAGMMRENGRTLEAVELYRSVAFAYRDQGRTQQAIAVCKSILEIAPDDSACQGLLDQLQGRASTVVPAGTSSSPSVPSLADAQTRPSESERVPHERMPRVVTTAPISVPSMPSINLTPEPEPVRRSSMDVTPLPKPMPYHEADRTSQPSKLSARELDERATQTTGLAQAARHISGLFSHPSTPGIPNHEMDLSAELDTRQRPKIRAEELRKITEQDMPMAPTHLDDLLPRETEEDLPTDRIDELLTPPPRSSEDAMTPPPLSGRVPTGLGRKPPPPLPIPRPGGKLTIPPKPQVSRNIVPRKTRDSDEMTSVHQKVELDDDDDEEDTEV